MDVIVERKVPWAEVYDLALETMGKEPRGVEPTSAWKRKILRTEHSPIRALTFKVRLVGVPYWVSVHLVRHKFGVEHYVSTQRTDRTGEARDKKPQDAPVNHTMWLNAEAVIAISRKRLCGKASPETRAAWQAVVDGLRRIGEVELADACVPECVHQGGVCPEFTTCGRSPSCWEEA